MAFDAGLAAADSGGRGRILSSRGAVVVEMVPRYSDQLFSPCDHVVDSSSAEAGLAYSLDESS